MQGIWSFDARRQKLVCHHRFLARMCQSSSPTEKASFIHPSPASRVPEEYWLLWEVPSHNCVEKRPPHLKWTLICAFLSFMRKTGISLCELRAFSMINKAKSELRICASERASINHAFSLGLLKSIFFCFRSRVMSFHYGMNFHLRLRWCWLQSLRFVSNQIDSHLDLNRKYPHTSHQLTSELEKNSLCLQFVQYLPWLADWLPASQTLFQDVE